MWFGECGRNRTYILAVSNIPALPLSYTFISFSIYIISHLCNLVNPFLEISFRTFYELVKRLLKTYEGQEVGSCSLCSSHLLYIITLHEKCQAQTFQHFYKIFVQFALLRFKLLKRAAAWYFNALMH